MRKDVLVLLSILALITVPWGCFQRPQIVTSHNPEIKMGTRRPADALHLGLVEARAAGSFQSCASHLSEAMDKLTIAARAAGGTGVEGISFRGRWRWQSNRPLCRTVWSSRRTRRLTRLNMSGSSCVRSILVARSRVFSFPARVGSCRFECQGPSDLIPSQFG